MRSVVFALLCLLPGVASAQIIMPDVIEPYKKIKAGCDCIIPEGGSLQILWKADAATQIEAVRDGLECFAWAPPGPHWLDAVVITYTNQKVFVPDPQFPEDLSKAKVQIIKIIDPLNGVQRFDRAFLVKERGPGPSTPTATMSVTPSAIGVGQSATLSWATTNATSATLNTEAVALTGTKVVSPVAGTHTYSLVASNGVEGVTASANLTVTSTPPPPPPPSDPFAAKAQEWLKAVPASAYTKAKALGIADNYAAVAAQAVATQDLYDVLAFSTQTKTKNSETVGGATELVNNWTPALFRPLAIYQDALAKERKIDIYRDEAGLAQIWRETAEALRKAAF